MLGNLVNGFRSLSGFGNLSDASVLYADWLTPPRSSSRSPPAAGKHSHLDSILKELRKIRLGDPGGTQHQRVAALPLDSAQ